MSKIKKTFLWPIFIKRLGHAHSRLHVTPRILHQMKDLIKLHKPKIKALFPLPFPEKPRFFLKKNPLFLPGNRVESKIKGLKPTFDKFWIFVKSCWFQHLPVLQLYKGHFRKTLTGFSSLAAYLMQNLMLNWLTPISNPKNEKAKISYVLSLLPFFILRPI